MLLELVDAKSAKLGAVDGGVYIFCCSKASARLGRIGGIVDVMT